MHPDQHGFIQAKSTISALHEITKICLQRKETDVTALVAVDISGEFDNAWHPAIIQQMDKANFPAPLIKIVISYLEDRKKKKRGRAEEMINAAVGTLGVLMRLLRGY
ncbi:hypothetical protein LAZ67_1006936 [Cordylochernes scorpioides]|uniref:Reverse transcriptase domain-containing protein n=1 Tax=Cordylochernes scorpioides TaxID=51811 RepID=A0ABY6JZ67_9ARAC|nr:hypothetical protein LAZ67_1006936 [Cordylochernes scorpioides]